MKIYTGIRDGEDCFVRVSPVPPVAAATEGATASGTAGVTAGGTPGMEPYLLPARPDLLRDWPPDLLPDAAGKAVEAPASFCLGEAGPGTDHLALAIAVDVAAAAPSADEAAAWLAGLAFLRRFLSHLPPDGFEIADTVFAALLKAAAPAHAGAPHTRRWMEAVGS